ncbi:MAG: Mth938-like domain-containing protein [Legionella sp.]
MQIHLEKPEQHAIQSYNRQDVKINNQRYHDNLIVSRDTIIHPWKANVIEALNMDQLQPILQCHPDIIIIGHSLLGKQLPLQILQAINQLQIGIETMDIGAASRTFNLLLSEHRRVVLAILF